MNDKTTPQPVPVDEAYYEHLAEQFSADDYELPAGTAVTRGEGDEPGREILARYMTPAELATADLVDRAGIA